MEPFTLQFAAESCAAELVNAPTEATVKRVVTDSRVAVEGDLFVAIGGEHFDGHDFVSNAFGRGALAAVVDRQKLPQLPSGKKYLAVADARRALGQIASSYRQKFKFTAIAIAGSNGKTSTKELIAAVLRQKQNVVWSDASFNNDIGVPLTLLKIESGHSAGVFEVGTNHPGELAPLVGMIQPKIGVITSIGREHLEFFGNLEGVIQEEGMLAEALPVGGTLFMNGDTAGVKELASRTRARVVRVGAGPWNDWKVSGVEMTPLGMSFQLDGPKAELSGTYRTRILGMHQAVNAGFAAALGEELGLGRAEIQRGLDSCTGAKSRLQLKSVDDFTLLDDSYNANVDSMHAALRTLQAFPCSGRRVAVLGDMAELGSSADEAHREVGRTVAELGIDLLVAVGKRSHLIVEAAQAGRLAEARAFEEITPAVSALTKAVRPRDVVLVKASRSTGLDRLVHDLEKHFESPAMRPAG